MTDRAKRAAEVLASYGWTFDDSYNKQVCNVCGHEESDPGNYCRKCGNKLTVQYGGTTLEELEAAIAAAILFDQERAR